MDTTESVKLFSPLGILFDAWKYCRDNQRVVGIFTLANCLLLILGFKLMGGMGSLLFIVWCAIYYLFWCCFFRFYYQRKPYVLTPKIFDSLIPSTKILFITLALATLLAYLPFLPLFFGLPEDVLDEYTTGFIQEYMDEKRIYDWGMTVILILVTPLIFYRPLFAWISAVIGRSGSLRNAWRRTRGNYRSFLLVTVAFNIAAFLIDWADNLLHMSDWLTFILGSPLVVFCNIYIAKSYDFFFLDLDTE